ncbi:MAG TPA: ankyrin repeat domain-containing protein [Gammaproteobacteria bacterium]|nr:ankyrin repeat domain-containing protein [Gammaproteobacteria bacterium]
MTHRAASTLRSRLVSLASGLVLLSAAGAPVRAAETPATPKLVAAAKADDVHAALALLDKGANADESEPDGTTALMWAVHYGELELTDKLIAAGAGVGRVNGYGASAMSEAAVRADPELLARLLAAGADVDSANADGQTALMVVARSGNVAAAKVLIDHGAMVDAREARKGQDALMWAAAQSQPQMVQLLLEHGADPNARSTTHDWPRKVTSEPRMKENPSGGFTPLLYAAREGCTECAKSLVDGGADIDLPDPDGVTPLLSAVLSAHFDTAKYLVEAGANVNKWDWWGRTPLYAAIDYDTIPHGGRPDLPSLDATSSLALAKLLIDRGANVNAQLKLFPPYRSLRMDRGADSVLTIGTTPLIRAARGADLDAMRLLLAHGALVDLPQAEGVTALMVAVGAGASPIDTRGKFRTEPEALAAAKVLAEARANLNARDARGRTALHAAAGQGYGDIVRWLVAQGADPKAADADGATPIDAALGKLAGRGRGGAAHPEIAELLRQLAAAPGN